VDFAIGDFIELICADGKTFRGVLMDFSDNYLVITPGLGFPFDSIKVVTYA
jgi:hypothetical protein